MLRVKWTTTVAWALVAGALSGSAHAEEGVSLSPEGAVLHERPPSPHGGRSSIPVFVYDPERRGVRQARSAKPADTVAVTWQLSGTAPPQRFW